MTRGTVIPLQTQFHHAVFFSPRQQTILTFTAQRLQGCGTTSREQQNQSKIFSHLKPKITHILFLSLYINVLRRRQIST